MLVDSKIHQSVSAFYYIQYTNLCLYICITYTLTIRPCANLEICKQLSTYWYIPLVNDTKVLGNHFEFKKIIYQK